MDLHESKRIAWKTIEEVLGIVSGRSINDGISDNATAMQLAIDNATSGQEIALPEGTFTLTSGLATSDSVPVIIRGRGKKTRLVKAFNGDMLTLGKGSTLDGVYLDGAGATFTGRGIVISSGALTDTDAARYVRNAWINDTESFGIEVTGANYGHASVFENLQVIPHSSATPAIALPTSTETNGNRTFIAIYTGSSPIFRLGASNNTQAIGCQGGEPIYTADTLKCIFQGGRIVNSSGTLTFDGTQNAILGTSVSTSIINFSSTLQYSSFLAAPFTASPAVYDDDSGGVLKVNDIHIPQQTYTPTVTTSGAAFVLDNGSISGTWSRMAAHCRGHITLTIGTGTTIGTGNYQFSLPYTCDDISIGSAGFFDASAPNSPTAGASYIASGGAVVRTMCGWSSAGAPADFAGAAIPFALAAGDQIWIDFFFPIR